MKLFTSQQLRELDEFTIREEPISSIDLMERAARQCVDWLKRQYTSTTSILVVCGQGNNGGDGLAIVRLLRDSGYHVTCLIVNEKSKGSTDFEINYKKLFEVKLVSEQRKLFDFLKYDVIVDALFGYGLTRPVKSPFEEIVLSINNSPAQVVSIDMPSGLYCDAANDTSDCIVEADHTLTFETIKRSQLLPMNQRFVGNLVVLPIGLHPELKQRMQSDFLYIEKSDIRLLLKPRTVYSHKGNFGHALIIAGSTGKMGAAILAGKACLRSGVGLLTMHVPLEGQDILQNNVHEAMVAPNNGLGHLVNRKEFFDDTFTIGVGPGIGQHADTHQFIKHLLLQNGPLVIDADAINILSQHPSWFNDIPPGSILTPHPKELQRLVGKWKNGFDKIEIVRAFCKLYNCYMVVKGAHTAVIEPNGLVSFNSTGNPGMATAGSGDVLTGIITSLVAQGYSQSDACKIGVFVHGLAGDLAADEIGQISLIASDIVNRISNAFQQIIHGK